MSVDSLTNVTVSPTGTFHVMAPEGVATLCGIDLSYPRRTWWPVWRGNFDRFTYRCAKCEREARQVGVCKCGHEE